jgi:hypothetical protein
MFHCFSCAFRHADGSVEGFLGFGFSDYSARKDCVEQVRRRVSAKVGTPQAVDISTFIFSERDLTPEEMESVRRDWAKGLRYATDGSLYSG